MTHTAEEKGATSTSDLNPPVKGRHKGGNRDMKEPNSSQCTTRQTCLIYVSVGRLSELQSRSNCSQKSAEQSRQGETSDLNK